ncbi:hypothetical protein BMI86_05735 [Thioclava sp. DLFJ5-1]|uniref:lipopolysaccharide biosynthesis protein n=1 Tax=Thioclava sp. DLFJ5-1 TaxID=1915314 RepID=UPI0009961C2C|nr:hypothetical protein [Thioclava sp. DLFJ5-1]OOY22027.1 hypothetical protein BMI86_05735 [Thioclava sp. DLFJ5-1]
MDIKYTRLANVTLRTATLGTRFLFVFILAKFLDPATVGYYGLFTATIGYALYFVGLDFYTYMTREVLRAPMEQRGQFLKTQGILSGGLYIVVIPIALAIISRVDWPITLVWWFLPILILEHYNQEIMRLLIALSEQLSASLVLFFRQGSWAIAISALMTFDPESRQLGDVLALWATGGFLAAAFGSWRVWRLEMGGWRDSVDWPWVRKGLTVSLAFLTATLSLRGIQTFDRYWVETLGGVEMVAAYVLFMGVASSLMVFLDAGVFSFTYPALIHSNHQGDYEKEWGLLRNALLQTLSIVIAFSLLSWLALPYLLNWIGKSIYQAEISLYPWILSATALNALGMIPHYALYARRRDKPIILSHIVGLFLFVACTWMIGQKVGTLAVPIALNLSFSLILAWKLLAFFSTRTHHITPVDKAPK